MEKIAAGVPCPPKEEVKNEEPTIPVKSGMIWATGVTTVPSRRETLLPATLASLKEAGFDRPRLFVDGENNGPWWEQAFGLEFSLRWPKIRTFGNWVLGLAELYIREPTAERYAMFQDDFVTYKNLRGYLESCTYPEKGYWNLYTFPANQKLVPRDLTVRREEKPGWFLSNQRGYGALALVFDRKTVITLLTHQHMVDRPLDPERGFKAVDGGVVTALNKAGYREWVHNPSLVQHTGTKSSMREIDPKHREPQPLAESFRGQEFDAMTLIGAK